MKPHIKVIQRNGVDIFVTSSMVMKRSKEDISKEGRYIQEYIGAVNNGTLKVRRVGFDPRQTSGNY